MTDNTHPQPQPYTFEEAPASWNTRYLDPSGFECQLTLARCDRIRSAEEGRGRHEGPGRCWLHAGSDEAHQRQREAPGSAQDARRHAGPDLVPDPRRGHEAP